MILHFQIYVLSYAYKPTALCTLITLLHFPTLIVRSDGELAFIPKVHIRTYHVSKEFKYTN